MCTSAYTHTHTHTHTPEVENYDTYFGLRLKSRKILESKLFSNT